MELDPLSGSNRGFEATVACSTPGGPPRELQRVTYVPGRHVGAELPGDDVAREDVKYGPAVDRYICPNGKTLRQHRLAGRLAGAKPEVPSSRLTKGRAFGTRFGLNELQSYRLIAVTENL